MERKTPTFYGTLNWHTFSAAEQYANSQGGNFPDSDISKATPTVDLLLTQPQLNKVIDFLTTEFLPWCADRHKAGEKKNALPMKQAKMMIDGLSDLEAQPFNTPLKPVNDKTRAIKPDAVATLRLKGNAGKDLKLKAWVSDETELKSVGPNDIVPNLFDLNLTNHEMYRGALVGATVGPYVYNAAGMPGVSFGITTVVWRADGPNLAGGVDVDIDAFRDDFID